MASGTDEPLRVVFDGYWWVEGPHAVREVMRSVVLAWAASFPDDDITVLVRRRHLAAVRADLPPGVHTFSTRLRPQAVLAFVGATLLARRLRADAVITHNFAAASPRSVVYLHDVMFLEHRQWFTVLERMYFAWMVPLARRAGAVVTSSRTEAERIRRHTRRDVVPVGIGMSASFLDGQSQAPEGMGSGSTFLLSVGRLNARKNLVRTIEACVSRRLVRPDLPLVVVGESDGAQESLSPEVQAAVAERSVRFFGTATAAELRWLYANASATLYLSLDEGYGMPPLESLALGTQVVVSDLSVMRENLGTFARYADPTDLDSIATAVRAALDMPPTPDAVRAAQAHARARTWEDVVGRLRAVVDGLPRRKGPR